MENSESNSLFSALHGRKIAFSRPWFPSLGTENSIDYAKCPSPGTENSQRNSLFSVLYGRKIAFSWPWFPSLGAENNTIPYTTGYLNPRGSIESAELSWSADLISRDVMVVRQPWISALMPFIGWCKKWKRLHLPFLLIYSVSEFSYAYIIGWSDSELGQWSGISSSVLTVTPVTWWNVGLNQSISLHQPDQRYTSHYMYYRSVECDQHWIISDQQNEQISQTRLGVRWILRRLDTQYKLIR